MKRMIYRILVNWYLASDKELPAWLKRACRQDKTLADELTAGDELTAALKSRPKERVPSLGSDSITSKVMMRITEEDYAAEQESLDKESGTAWVGWARTLGAAAVACVIAVIGIQNWMTQHGDKIAPDNGIVVTSTQPVDGIVEDAEIKADELLELGAQWKNPLDQEIEYVLSDAKGALDFLATNFVPSGILKKVDSDEKA